MFEILFHTLALQSCILQLSFQCSILLFFSVDDTPSQHFRMVLVITHWLSHKSVSSVLCFQQALCLKEEYGTKYLLEV